MVKRSDLNQLFIPLLFSPAFGSIAIDYILIYFITTSLVCRFILVSGLAFQFCFQGLVKASHVRIICDKSYFDLLYNHFVRVSSSSGIWLGVSVLFFIFTQGFTNYLINDRQENTNATTSSTLQQPMQEDELNVQFQ